MIVTWLPNRRKIDANSTPTAPLPRMTIDFGTSRSPIASSLVMIRLRSISTPGTLRGVEPVAMTISFDADRLCFSPSTTSTLPASGDRRGALDPFDLVLLEQKLDALGQAGHDLVLARLHLVHVDADGAFADRDAPFLDVLNDLERVRVLEQRLGRNAAPDQAGAAERFLLLDDRHLQSQLRRANGRDVPAGSCANDHDIEFARHVISALRHCAHRFGVASQQGNLLEPPEGVKQPAKRATIPAVLSMNPKPKTVLIVDDDEGMRDTLNAILRRDYRVLRAATGEAALAILNREDVDLMLLDVRLPGIGGFDVLRIVKENYSLIEVIMISAITEIETAVQAMKFGAYHYTTKDFDYETIRSLVHNASERQDLNRQVMTLSAQVADQGDREFIVGPSKLTRDIVDLVQKVAKLSATVLILGESGTGKELLARLIHRESGNADAPFIAVNLAAIPRELVESTLFGHERGSFTGALKQQLGKFELASGGTLFLDEIGDLPLELQAKLLRAIQEGEIERVGGAKPIKTDFRLIAATNVDLEKAVKEGRFREDLFYRINVIPIKLPPLRDRIEDLPELARFFLEPLQGAIQEGHSGHLGLDAEDPVELLVAGQHPRAREPDRAAGGRQRQGMDYRRGSAVRVPLRAARQCAQPGREPVPGGDQHLRAELHPARAGEIGLERHRDGALPRHSPQHAQIQDGSAGHSRAREETSRRLASGFSRTKSRPIHWPLRPSRWRFY